ncbi:fasciclin domain-containing protein [Flavobacterium sp. AS60]|uniref:fasciclin domain-containing protein n=1 Tax=Flavobacterium anseongense TaxID=2910677 RepID=UPI001F44E7D1|nr:fasciclin domain-containing protein [Flavobacterium sp. AS60]MCF6130405.1 fasciclin domain-containing protein [Flavobacterium sp. AS60]
MKKLTKFIGIAFLSLTIFSCSSDSDSQPTIVDIASANSDFSTLVTALNRTGLTATLDGSGQFTVFAPTNTAFQTFFASLGPSVTVNNVDVNVLKNVLLNHVIASEIKSTAIPAATYVSTLSPINTSANAPTISMFVQKSGGVVTLNGGASNGGAVVTTADLDASNGVIHVVGNVIGLPTVVNHAIANPEFTSLVGALTSSGQPDFVSILSGTGPFTVFAPNNAAFTSLNTELAPGGIAGVSTANLTKVLTYHVVSPANVRSNTLTEGQVVTPILTPAQTFTVLLSGGARLRDANNRECNIIATDVQALNGVIHVLSKVLLPTL